MRFLLLAILLLLSAASYSQSFEVSSFFPETNKKGIIEGVISDKEVDNEPLAFANIGIKNSNIETSTNLDGTFSINIKPGTYTLLISFIGYKTIEIENVVVTSNSKTINNQSLAALSINTDISSGSLN